MTSGDFHVGQRWVSEFEPELGLGAVLQVTARTVSVVFPASGVVRQYARAEAPLKRVAFRVGDTIERQGGSAHRVLGVTSRGGLLHYRVTGAEIDESELSDTIGFSTPMERIRAGHIDPCEWFELRVETLRHRSAIHRSPLRGFRGARIELIPHQLYIAHEVAHRDAPRVLLADEVGLGKTIEAGMILHHQYLNGLAQRVLIVVPTSLIHQWFVEMLRRFNLRFSIFDEERCVAIDSAGEGANPFFDEQLVLTSIEFLATSPSRAQEACAAGWDLLIVDEAHHLAWTPEASSPEYDVVESLGRTIPGLLLLTATPEQMGEASHFARLRLLDPARYSRLDAFLAEVANYRTVAGLIAELVRGRVLGEKESRSLLDLFGARETDTRRRLDAVAAGQPGAREELIADLLDQYGTGRVMFRNTRAGMAGFPRRILHLAPLDPAVRHVAASAGNDFYAGPVPDPREGPLDLARDPRVQWLAGLLRELGDEKVLLICRSKETVLAIDEALHRTVAVKTAQFHEDLPLLQRDRHAAWFHEDEGAQILLCSEIGGEGRNFQFAHHLVLFDLPLDPELLEQRIGRLDRIGQRESIHIHVPYLNDGPTKVIARWYHEGLNAFEEPLKGAYELGQRFKEQVMALAATPDGPSQPMDCLIAESRRARDHLLRELEAGRDRLLELRSFHAETAERLMRRIAASDEDQELEAYTLRVFDHYGVHAETLSAHSMLLKPGHMLAEPFPALPEEGVTVTYDRATALAREEFMFMSWDHPMVSGAIEMLLGSEQGNAAVSFWEAPDREVLVEVIYVLEVVSPLQAQADRFLPPTPIRIVVDHRGRDRTEEVTADRVARHARDARHYRLHDDPALTQTLVPEMLDQSVVFAGERSARLIEDALATMRKQMTTELARLRALREVNDHIRPAELNAIGDRRDKLEEHIKKARTRLDSVRVIWRGPVERLPGVGG